MKNKILSECTWVIAFIALFILIKSSFLSFYLVPSSSMMPNVIPGDRVMLNKLAYGLWLPFCNSPIIAWGFPKRGDVILFESPNGEGTFVKRVIGLPGDSIAFQLGHLVVNGEQVEQNYLQKVTSLDVQSIEYIEKNEKLKLQSHRIIMSQEPGNTYFESGRFIVPPHKVFVLGDNRDSSVDSRVFGFVDERSFYGKASFILFSTAGDEGLLPKFRSERFFKKID